MFQSLAPRHIAAALLTVGLCAALLGPASAQHHHHHEQILGPANPNIKLPDLGNRLHGGREIQESYKRYREAEEERESGSRGMPRLQRTQRGGPVSKIKLEDVPDEERDELEQGMETYVLRNYQPAPNTELSAVTFTKGEGDRYLVKWSYLDFSSVLPDGRAAYSWHWSIWVNRSDFVPQQTATPVEPTTVDDASEPADTARPLPPPPAPPAVVMPVRMNEANPIETPMRKTQVKDPVRE